jgi:hypothetical protein
MYVILQIKDLIIYFKFSLVSHLGINKTAAELIRDLSVSKAVLVASVYEHHYEVSFYDTYLLLAQHNPRNGE